MKPNNFNTLKKLCRFYLFAGVTIIIVGVANWIIGLVTQNTRINGFGTVVQIDILGLLAPITMGLVVYGLGQLIQVAIEILEKTRESHEVITKSSANKG